MNVDVITTEGNITVPAERLTDDLAITPSIGQDEDGALELGAFNVTHLPTGRSLTTPACIGCTRDAARAIVEIGLDWSAITADESANWSKGLSDDTKEALRDAVIKAAVCDGLSCKDWSEC